MIISRATKVNSGFISVVHNGFYRNKKITNIYTMFKSKDKEFVFAIICVKVGWYLGWHLTQAVGIEGKKLLQPKSQKLSNLWQGVFITSATTTVYHSNHLLSCKYIPMVWVLGRLQRDHEFSIPGFPGRDFAKSRDPGIFRDGISLIFSSWDLF